MKLKKINIIYYNNEELTIKLITNSKKKVSITDTITISTKNPDYQKLNKVLKHSKKVIIIINDAFNFQHTFPKSVDDDIDNIILNMNSNIIIPTDKREIKYIKLDENKTHSQYYVSIFDKDNINKLRFFLFKNKFKILNILDKNISFYYFISEKHGKKEKDTIYYLFDSDNYHYYFKLNDNIFLNSISLVNTDDDKFIDYLCLKNKINIKEISLKKEIDEEYIIKGAISSIIYDTSSNLFNYKKLKKIKISSENFSKILNYGITIIILNTIFISIALFLLIQKNESIKNETEKNFLKTYTTIRRIVRMDAQAQNENIQMQNNIKQLKSNIEGDKKIIFKIRNIIRSIYNDKDNIHISNKTYNENYLEITGRCENNRILNNAVAETNKIPFVSNVDIIRTQRENLLHSDGIDFTIRIFF